VCDVDVSAEHGCMHMLLGVYGIINNAAFTTVQVCVCVCSSRL